MVWTQVFHAGTHGSCLHVALPAAQPLSEQVGVGHSHLLSFLPGSPSPLLLNEGPLITL